VSNKELLKAMAVVGVTYVIVWYAAIFVLISVYGDGK